MSSPVPHSFLMSGAVARPGSLPPGDIDEEVLQNWSDLKADTLRRQYKRHPTGRVFVNRDLRMDKIQYVGSQDCIDQRAVDMDYTIAVYKSPAYEELSYGLAVHRLIEMGYPSAIGDMHFNPSFPIRGLFLDKTLGNLLKIDRFGYILRCVHGHRRLGSEEVRNLYPPMQIHHSDIGQRFFLLNTLFNVVDACLYSDLVNFLETQSQPSLVEVANESEESFDISYSNLFQDVRSAVDYIHQRGQLKEKTMLDLEKYIERDDRTSKLFDRIRASGKKLFLMTNSGFAYTDKVMSYMLDRSFNDQYENWKDYFDYIIVGARKPVFFQEGTTLREVDLETGSLKIGHIHELKSGHVYNGGSMKKFGDLTGATGPEVLYVGDHIFADIITSKKRHGWRNLLVVRELAGEIETWIAQQKTYLHLRNLEFIRAELYRGLDSETTEPPNIEALSHRMDETIEKLSESYNEYFGSLFQDGSKHSFFGMQVQRYADLYTSDYRNLLNYPLFYYFSSWPTYFPHHILGGGVEGVEEGVEGAE